MSMDPDLRETLKEIKEDLRSGLKDVAIKLDTQSDILTAHTVGLAEVRARADGAHARIDSYKEARANSKKWWLGVVSSVVILWIISIWDWIKRGGLKP